MKQDELFHYVCMYVIGDFLTYERIRRMGVENFYQYIKEHFIPIPKSELVVGQEYKGHCRNSDKATWDGKEFRYERYKFGDTFEDTINHYEDDDGYDVFVPIKEI